MSLCACLTCNEAGSCRCVKTQTEEAKEERAKVHGLLPHSTVGTSGAPWSRAGDEPREEGKAEDTNLLLNLLTES